MRKESFVFYPQILQIAETLTTDDRVIGEAMLAVVRYGIMGQEYLGSNPIISAVMLTAKPLINTAKNKRAAKQGSKNHLSGMHEKIRDGT